MLRIYLSFPSHSLKYFIISVAKYVVIKTYKIKNAEFHLCEDCVDYLFFFIKIAVLFPQVQIRWNNCRYQEDFIFRGRVVSLF